MVEQLTANELYERLEAGEEIQVVDTRSSDAYEAGHIPGAENLPYGELADRIDEIDWGDEIVLVCEIGQSSEQAGRILESYEGIDDDTLIANLEDGYDGWEYELES